MKTMRTYIPKPSDIRNDWHVLDATNRVLGRLATEISIVLQGKHRPNYSKNLLTGDYVIVVNSSKIKITGNKLQQKLYRSHSQYPGGLRETPMYKLLANHPDRIIRSAVKGMLPKNILGRQMLRRLKIYPDELHPHGAQIKDYAIPENSPPSLLASDRIANDPASVEITNHGLIIDNSDDEPVLEDNTPTDQPTDQLVENNESLENTSEEETDTENNDTINEHEPENADDQQHRSS